MLVKVNYNIQSSIYGFIVVNDKSKTCSVNLYRIVSETSTLNDGLAIVDYII